MKTKTINIYEYNELSEKAKQRVLDYFASDVDAQFCWEYIIEDAKDIGLIIESLEDHRPNKGYFETSASDCANKILVNHGPDCETHKTAKTFLEGYAICMAIQDEDLREETLETYEADFLQSLLEDYRILLHKDIEYQQSEKAIIELIEVNEYMFDESGWIA